MIYDKGSSQCQKCHFGVGGYFRKILLYQTPLKKILLFGITLLGKLKKM